MIPRSARQALLLGALLTAVAPYAEAQEAATAGAPRHSVWRPVWFIEGPITTQVSLDEADNELRIDGNEIVLALADGQRWAMAVQALQSIRYFRQFERPSAVIVSGDAWAPNPAALYRSTNHFVELVFSDERKQVSVVTLRLGKRVYQAVIATVQQLATKPVLASTEDAKALPATVKTERSSDKRTLIPRRPAIGPTVALRVASDTTGRMLASVLNDGSIQVWDLETGRAIRRWLAVEGFRPDWHPPASIAFRPGTSIVAVSTGSGVIQQWDAQSGARGDVVIPTSAGGHDMPFCFSPDGAKVIVGGSSDGFSCWNAETGTRLDCLRTYNASLQEEAVGSSARSSGRAAAFSAEGTQLMLATHLTGARKPRLLTILEWPGGRLLRQVRQGGDYSFRSIGFASNGLLIERYPEWLEASQLTGPQPTRLWRARIPIRHDQTVIAQQLIVAAGRDQEILLYSADTGRREARLATAAWVSAVAFVPGGRLAVATPAGTIQIWDMSARRIIRVLGPNP